MTKSYSFEAFVSQMVRQNSLPTRSTLKEERKKFREEKKANTERLRNLKRELKALQKLEAEAEEKRGASRKQAEREIGLANEAATDLLRVCTDTVEARRYFTIVERPEIEENEFKLNLPR